MLAFGETPLISHVESYILVHVKMKSRALLCIKSSSFDAFPQLRRAIGVDTTRESSLFRHNISILSPQTLPHVMLAFGKTPLVSHVEPYILAHIKMKSRALFSIKSSSFDAFSRCQQMSLRRRQRNP